MQSFPLSQITLIGVGLIGGSFALALKEREAVQTIVGVDTDADNLQQAIELNIIDQAFAQLCPSTVAHSQIIILATPVASIPSICQQIADWIMPDTIITDVGSTKQSVLTAFQQHLPQHFARCVAVHPIAGSEKNGASSAFANLFAGQKLIICPHEQQNPQAYQTIKQLWQSVGAITHDMDAQEHDQIFACVSHLPHLLAFSYMQQVLKQTNARRCLQYTGGGFKGFTRIAASSPKMWADIAFANQPALLKLIAEQKQELELLENLLKNKRYQELLQYFGEAADERRQHAPH